MTVIRPNSISGVTSITALANEINVFKHDGVLAGLQLNGVNHHTSSGVSTFHTLNVLGNVSVGGTLTYEDVTNIDSVGIITARSGVHVGTGIHFTSNNGVIQTSSSGHTLGIQGGATNMGGRIELRGGNSTGDIRMFAQGATSTQVERLRIRSDGKVGIGTDMVGAPASNYGFGVYRATGTGYLYTETGQSGASAGLRAKAGTSDFTIFTTQGVGQLAVYDNTNSAERLRIKNDGNVGIGTNNPSSKLHVASTNTTVWPFASAVSTNYSYNPYPHELVIDNDVKGTEGSFAGIFFNAGSDTDGSKVSTARIAAVDTGNYKADLVFSNRGYSNSDHKENLRITYNGDVRVGGGSPATFGSGTTVHETYNANTYVANLVTSGTHQLQMIASQTHGATSIGTRSNHDLNLCANDSTKMTITTDGKVGINETSPSNQLHIAGTTGSSAGGLLRLDATTGDNFIIFDNTGDNSEWVIGNDAGSNDEFRMYYNSGSGYGQEIINIEGTTNFGRVTIDGGTNTLVNIRADSGGAAGLRLGGQAGSGTDQCTGYVEVHQDESHGGGFFYNGDGSPSFATGEGADYFSLFRLSSGTRHSVMRWFHNSNECNVQGNMLIDNGTSTIVRVRGDSSGTAGISCGGDGGQTQCTGYLECHQDQIHGGGISYNGDGSPGFVNNETADNITFYRMNNSTRERVFSYPYNSNTVNFRGTIVANAANSNIKNFKIPHPHPSKKDTHDLVHSSIEGPQADNIYRGKVSLSSGSATINLDTVSNMTDGTFVLLNRDIQCFTSNETGWGAVKGSVSGNILTITAQDGSSTDTISWMVVGERQDDSIKSSEIDTTDADGKIIVELLKGS